MNNEKSKNPNPNSQIREEGERTDDRWPATGEVIANETKWSEAISFFGTWETENGKRDFLMKEWRSF